ncbi:MAG: hypothetical protein K2O42_03540 [Oscillospiraceae bacterium]|nr:hypothetical protein [Oscillospiraceae bacterium]
MNENVISQEKLQEISGFNQLTEDDKAILELMLKAITMFHETRTNED